MVAGRATLVSSSSSSFSWRRAAPPPAARRQRRLPSGGREWTTSGRYESVPSSGEWSRSSPPHRGLHAFYPLRSRICFLRPGFDAHRFTSTVRRSIPRLVFGCMQIFPLLNGVGIWQGVRYWWTELVVLGTNWYRSSSLRIRNGGGGWFGLAQGLGMGSSCYHAMQVWRWWYCTEYSLQFWKSEPAHYRVFSCFRFISQISTKKICVTWDWFIQVAGSSLHKGRNRLRRGEYQKCSPCSTACGTMCLARQSSDYSYLESIRLGRR
jgi:hypothetical protein